MKESYLVFFLLIFILAVHILAIANFWYWTISWFDIPMHFLGGFWVAVFFFWILKKKFIQLDQVLKGNFLLLVILSLGFVSLIGVLWEFYEFLYDRYISSLALMQENITDTMTDLLMDLIGGFTAVLLYLVSRKPHV